MPRLFTDKDVNKDASTMHFNANAQAATLEIMSAAMRGALLAHHAAFSESGMNLPYLFSYILTTRAAEESQWRKKTSEAILPCKRYSASATTGSIFFG